MDSEYIHVEVDQEDGPDNDDGHLPTYQELAQHAPPNSRFGRWREWIDKRAAERFADQSEEDRTARRERLGWGEGILASPTDFRDPCDEHPLPPPPPVAEPPSRPTSASSSRPLPVPPVFAPDGPSPSVSPPLPPVPTHPPTPEALPIVTSLPLPLGVPLPPTSLASYNFGSRFIPHSPLPILSLLPLAASDRFLLLGTAEGLAVLDVLPRLHGAEAAGPGRGLEDARRREVWTGVGVCQCALVEEEACRAEVPGSGEDGIVLMLVSLPSKGGLGAEDKERRRELRMYKLSSLLSLVRWTVSQEDSRPLDLTKSLSQDSAVPSPKKDKDRARNRLSRPLRLDLAPSASSSSGSSTPLLRPTSPQPPRRSSSQRSTRERAHTTASHPHPAASAASLPYRWATDFEPFHHQRLPAHDPVLFFELWRAEEYGQFGRMMLVVATGKNVVLFEAPVGERAWTFVKEYYVPHPPKSARFIYQSVPPALPPVPAPTRAPTDPTVPTPYYPPTTPSPSHSVHARASGEPLPQLSLYLTFEKKAVVVRLSDAAVSEVDLWSPLDEAGSVATGEEHQHSPPGLHAGGSLRRKHASLDSGLGREKGEHVSPPPLVPIYLPVPPSLPASPASPTEPKLFYLLTRARFTHIYASPLPFPPQLLNRPPLYRHTWKVQAPREVVVRISAREDQGGGKVQLMGFGSAGVEVVELAIADIINGAGGAGGASGKGKALPCAIAILHEGLETGFLHSGGRWDEHSFRTSVQHLHPAATASSMSGLRPGVARIDSDESQSERERRRRVKEGRGVYGWVRRDVEDERVFWLGGCDRIE